jgi:tetratricopeptide (TPR) repeat protein
MFVMRMAVLAALLMVQHPETLSLLGEPLYAPKLPKAERAAAEADFARAHAAYSAKPSGTAEILALQQAHLALGRIGDALVVLTHGIEVNQEEPALYFARGRGYLLIRKFDVAARDLKKAAEKLPAARCALGFAHYLSADFDRARAAYADCPDSGVFGYLAERRAGGTAATPPTPPTPPTPEGRAPTTPAPIRFPGTVKKAPPAEPIAASYLAAIERLLTGEQAKTEDERRKAEDDARERLAQIVEKNRRDWMEPAYIAAEADYARLKKPARRKGKP